MKKEIIVNNLQISYHQFMNDRPSRDENAGSKAVEALEVGRAVCIELENLIAVEAESDLSFCKALIARVSDVEQALRQLPDELREKLSQSPTGLIRHRENPQEWSFKTQAEDVDEVVSGLRSHCMAKAQVRVGEEPLANLNQRVSTIRDNPESELTATLELTRTIAAAGNDALRERSDIRSEKAQVARAVGALIKSLSDENKSGLSTELSGVSEAVNMLTITYMEWASKLTAIEVENDRDSMRSVDKALDRTIN